MPSPQRAVAVVLALVAWLWSGGALLSSLLWGVGLRCFDACDGQGWRRSPDGWQWDGVVVLGVLVFVAGTAFLAFVWRRRTRGAVASFLAGLAAVLALATAFSPEWPEHLDDKKADHLALYAIGLAAPLAALLLARGGTRSGRQK